MLRLLGRGDRSGSRLRHGGGPAEGSVLCVESLQTVRNLGIDHRIIDHKGINDQLLHVSRDGEATAVIREDPRAVGIQVGQGKPDLAGMLQGLVNIDLYHAFIAGHIQIPVLRQFAVGIGRGHIGKAVGDPQINRLIGAA